VILTIAGMLWMHKKLGRTDSSAASELLRSNSATTRPNKSSPPALTDGSRESLGPISWDVLARKMGAYPMMLALKVTNPITVDGHIDEQEWSDAFETILWEATTNAPTRISARFLWDDMTLHATISSSIHGAVREQESREAHC